MSDQENSVDPTPADLVRVEQISERVKAIITESKAFIVIEYEEEDLEDFKRIKNPKIFSEICRRVADGELLCDVLESDKDRFPRSGNFYRFIEMHESAKEAYMHARTAQMHVWGDKFVKRSFDDSRDVIENEIYDKHGTLLRVEKRSDNTAVNRDRLIADNMKWLMSRVASGAYSDKANLEVSGSVQITPIVELNMKGVAITAPVKEIEAPRNVFSLQAHSVEEIQVAEKHKGLRESVGRTKRARDAAKKKAKEKAKASG